MRRPKLGATGTFPRGKLDPTDEGELTLAVGYDRANDLVRIEFGKPVAWLALPRDVARAFAMALAAAAQVKPSKGAKQ